MIKKTDTLSSQIVTKTPKQSHIPHDFEPVSRDKQDEEKDDMYQHAGDKQNSRYAVERFDDDGPEDGVQLDDSEPTEDVLSEVESPLNVD